MNLMPEVGFFEIVVVAIVALIVVGPKDLPRLMAMAGKALREARRLASEFSAAFHQMARDSEMEEMRLEIEALKRDNVFAETRRDVEGAVRPVASALREESTEITTAVKSSGPAA